VAPYLVERIGYSQARRLAVSGGRVEGPAALALGLVHELHAPAQLDGALARVLAEILACAPGAIASTKSLLARSLRSSPAELIDAAARTFAEAVLGEEGTEGTMAFLQRRAPRWAPQ
jgi:isohexenylglutaconyl-CoA hydratase